MYQHKIPIHLEQEDKFLLQLTGRQTLILASAATVAYSAWPTDDGPLGLVLGCVMAAAIMAVALALAFVRIKHRDLEQWLIVALLYLSQPHHYYWSPLLVEESAEEEEAAIAQATLKREKEEEEEW